MLIRKGSEKDLPQIALIYDDILKEEESGRTSVGWVRGIYPTEAVIKNGLAAEDLFVMTVSGETVAAARINNTQSTEYRHAAWQKRDILPHEVMVLHTLTVSPRHSGKGFGTAFVRFYEEYAKLNSCRVLRMDTVTTNFAARSLYRKLGFHEVGDVPCSVKGLEHLRLICLEKILRN